MKNTPGNMCQVFVPSAEMLAEPIKFDHSQVIEFMVM